MTETQDARRHPTFAIGVFVTGCALTLFAPVVPAGAPRLLAVSVTGAIVAAAGTYVSVRLRSAVWASWSLYIAVILAGSALRDGGLGRTGLWVIAVAATGCALLSMTLVVRHVRRSKELERFISTEGATLAFFATMIGALTYALFEVWVDLPRLSMWAVFMFGMLVWGGLSIFFGRRYS